MFYSRRVFYLHKRVWTLWISTCFPHCWRSWKHARRAEQGQQHVWHQPLCPWALDNLLWVFRISEETEFQWGELNHCARIAIIFRTFSAIAAPLFVLRFFEFPMTATRRFQWATCVSLEASCGCSLIGTRTQCMYFIQFDIVERGPLKRSESSIYSRRYLNRAVLQAGQSDWIAWSYHVRTQCTIDRLFQFGLNQKRM